MHILTLKTIVNRVQPLKGFVYVDIRFSQVQPNTVEVLVLPRLRSQGCCSGCGQRRPGYDHLPTRTWLMRPLWIFSLVLLYTMRRVDCPTCGVVVEQVPWASAKHTLTEGFRLLLAHRGPKLSWQEVAESFGVAWADVYGAVLWVVGYGLAHRDLSGIVAVGMDEVCVRVGRVFWTLVYQIDAGRTRLLEIGWDRSKAALEFCLEELGPAVCGSIRYVCSDLWRPYLEVVRERLPQVLHILDRFHIRQEQNQAIDEIRKAETRALTGAGLAPRLKTPALGAAEEPAELDAGGAWTDEPAAHRWAGLAASVLVGGGLRTFLGLPLAHVGREVPPGVVPAGAALAVGAADAGGEHLGGAPRVAVELVPGPQAPLGGVIEGLNNKVKRTFRKACGFRTDDARVLALYHALGKLPEPKLTHKFF